MKIAYFSPFSPDPSGVSDFSEELLPELHKYMDIAIYARKKPTTPQVIEEFEYHQFDDIHNYKLRQEYSLLVYQVGNNINYHKGVIDTFLKYPGILEIHDLSLHHYLAEDTFVKNNHDKYISIMKYCHGNEGENAARKFLNGQIRAPWETDSAKYTVNKHLIDRAQGIIVHSDFAKQFVKGIRPNVPVINIPLHTPDIVDDCENFKLNCQKKLKINMPLVLGSFGYATAAKRIPTILKALGDYKKVNSNFIYYIVGKVENIDLPKLLTDYDLTENVIVTGFVDIETFKIYMGACDICFNLRFPTQGESSASLHRMLGFGKPILVTNIGAFAEYPDDIVLKIRHDENEKDDILQGLIDLTANEKELCIRSHKAVEYARENCNLRKNAKRYYDFLNSVLNNTYQDTYLDYLLDVLYELGLNSENFIHQLNHFLI